jgi:hypothetical protein
MATEENSAKQSIQTVGGRYWYNKVSVASDVLDNSYFFS